MSSYYIKQFIDSNHLLPGDGIVVKKRFLGLLKHYVIYMGKMRGQHVFVANTKSGVSFLSARQIGEYLQYLEPRRIIPFEGSKAERKRALTRVFQYPSPESYHLLANNCEHFFSYVHEGEGYSKQTAIFGAGLVATGAIITAKNANKSLEEDENADLKTAAGILVAGLGLLTLTLASKD